MKDFSLRRSLSERKLGKKERKEKTQSVNFERSLTPISIIGEKKGGESMVNGDTDHTMTNDARSKKKKFWKLKVILCLLLSKHLPTIGSIT